MLVEARNGILPEATKEKHETVMANTLRL